MTTSVSLRRVRKANRDRCERFGNKRRCPKITQNKTGRASTVQYLFWGCRGFFCRWSSKTGFLNLVLFLWTPQHSSSSWPSHTKPGCPLTVRKVLLVCFTTHSVSRLSHSFPAVYLIPTSPLSWSTVVFTPQYLWQPGWWIPARLGSLGSGSTLCWRTCGSKCPRRSRSSAHWWAPAVRNQKKWKLQ